MGAVETPLCRYDGWTEDSSNPNWMAEFKDFVGNLFDNENLDWELFDDRSTKLSDDDGLDIDRYAEFTKADGRSPEVIGTVKE